MTSGMDCNCPVGEKELRGDEGRRVNSVNARQLASTRVNGIQRPCLGFSLCCLAVCVGWLQRLQYCRYCLCNLQDSELENLTTFKKSSSKDG